MRFLALVWVLCACGGQVTGSDVDASSDASTQGDVCVDLDPSHFDQSCSGSSDCIGVYGGVLCTGYDCACPTGTIGVKDQAKYGALVAKVPKGGNNCTCPFFGSPQCIASKCVFCPNPSLDPPTLPPGCPDGGP